MARRKVRVVGAPRWKQEKRRHAYHRGMQRKRAVGDQQPEVSSPPVVEAVEPAATQPREESKPEPAVKKSTVKKPAAKKSPAKKKEAKKKLS
tara:strand:- start:397 stop:672 length:276 start_codon:yes stop_codon:yes gene_type:complete